MASASTGARQESAVIKLGYKASAGRFTPGKLLGFSCLVEEVGFDSVFISDHFQPRKHVDGIGNVSARFTIARTLMTSVHDGETLARATLGSADALASQR
jgi:alkanesulfonate monooxygenase SsuD/methylene tetrahydromethanopterin reductase-like flavin-dependent oxidoreductase (luciferase family)